MNPAAHIGTWTKRFLFFIGGCIIAFPSAGFMMLLGFYPQLYNTPDIFQIPAVIFGLVLFLGGMAAIFHAFMLKK